MLDCTCQTLDTAFAGQTCLEQACRPGIRALRRAMLEQFRGRIAIVSSFGAESAVLLAIAASIDPHVPVLFVDTGKHFAETLEYRDELAGLLGLTDVRSVGPSSDELRAGDPPGALWRFDPDACCKLRKVTPLERALAPFDAWVTGRKRHQALTRVALPFVEHVDGKTKINPLADWLAGEIEDEMIARDLPRHKLSVEGYLSIGCAPCTRAVAMGEDPRSGRWAGTGKTECGMHRLPESIE